MQPAAPQGPPLFPLSPDEEHQLQQRLLIALNELSAAEIDAAELAATRTPASRSSRPTSSARRENSPNANSSRKPEDTMDTIHTPNLVVAIVIGIAIVVGSLLTLAALLAAIAVSIRKPKAKRSRFD